jgi:hypothetical protein
VYRTMKYFFFFSFGGFRKREKHYSWGRR